MAPDERDDDLSHRREAAVSYRRDMAAQAWPRPVAGFGAGSGKHHE